MSAPPCPHCGTDDTQYGEYGVMCMANGGPEFGDTDCPIIFFEDQ